MGNSSPQTLFNRVRDFAVCGSIRGAQIFVTNLGAMQIDIVNIDVPLTITASVPSSVL